MKAVQVVAREHVDFVEMPKPELKSVGWAKAKRRPIDSLDFDSPETMGLAAPSYIARIGDSCAPRRETPQLQAAVFDFPVSDPFRESPER